MSLPFAAQTSLSGDGLMWCGPVELRNGGYANVPVCASVCIVSMKCTSCHVHVHRYIHYGIHLLYVLCIN